jgi:hypothetical protein
MFGSSLSFTTGVTFRRSRSTGDQAGPSPACTCTDNVPSGRPFPDALALIRIHTTGKRITEKHQHLSLMVIAVGSKFGGT